MDIFDKKLVIATHYLVYGVPQALRDYLINNQVKKLLFIAHPIYAESGHSYFELIEKSRIKNKKISSLRTRISVINYLIETFLTLVWVFSGKERYDLFVGFDNLNALAGLILRSFGRVDKVVYYTIDYSPQRFPNQFLNFVYHKIDSFCVKHVNIVWNVSPRIAEGRRKTKGLNFLKKQKVVPIGVWFDKVKRRPLDKVERHQLLFLGNLLEKQGVQVVINAIPAIIKEIPDFHFLIVGGGSYEKSLREQVDKMGLGIYVTFTGWIKDRKRLDGLISESACAVAPYDPVKAGFTYYADPTKIKDYLSAGLPVILTNVSYNAKEIEKKKCGIVVNYKKEDITRTVIDLLGDEDKLRIYRENAVKYAKQFDWNKIFSEHLREI